MIDYQGNKWKRKRKTILRHDGYKCQVSKMFGGTKIANTVHHTYPAEEYSEYAWCDWNLINVNQSTHNQLENRKTGELTAMGCGCNGLSRY